MELPNEITDTHILLLLNNYPLNENLDYYIMLNGVRDMIIRRKNQFKPLDKKERAELEKMVKHLKYLEKYLSNPPEIVKFRYETHSFLLDIPTAINDHPDPIKAIKDNKKSQINTIIDLKSTYQNTLNSTPILVKGAQPDPMKKIIVRELINIYIQATEKVISGSGELKYPSETMAFCNDIFKYLGLSVEFTPAVIKNIVQRYITEINSDN